MMTQTVDILEQTRRILTQQPATAGTPQAATACCSAEKQDACCEPSEKSSCCGAQSTSTGGCGCQ